MDYRVIPCVWIACLGHQTPCQIGIVRVRCYQVIGHTITSGNKEEPPARFCISLPVCRAHFLAVDGVGKRLADTDIVHRPGCLVIGCYEIENGWCSQALYPSLPALCFQLDEFICGETAWDIYLAPLQHGDLGGFIRHQQVDDILEGGYLAPVIGVGFHFKTCSRDMLDELPRAGANRVKNELLLPDALKILLGYNTHLRENVNKGQLGGHGYKLER